MTNTRLLFIVAILAILAGTLLGCADRPMHETYYDRLWRNPCAWRTASRQDRNIRVAHLAVEGHFVGEDDAVARVAAQEEERCRLSGFSNR